MAGELHGGVISSVAPGSVGAEVGLEPGDRLLAIDGHALRDLIDYRYYSDAEELTLEIERAGEHHTLEIERDLDEPLGLDFAEIVFDDLRECANACPFCFVRQMPRGLRRSLYLRDDDYRYSFLLGNFVTLTNLSEADWARIATQHLSPLYVSIHASDLALRRKMLGNSSAPDVLTQIRRLGQMGILMHGQVVIVPGMNDGEALRQTITEVSALWPTVQTLALVPVGLTRFQRQPLRPLSGDEALAALALADEWAHLAKRFGTTWLYPADELYLLAGREVPAAAFYDDPAQQENGVGLVRALLEDWRRAKRRLRARKRTDGPDPMSLQDVSEKGESRSLFHVETRRRRVSTTETRYAPIFGSGHKITLACGQLIALILTELAGELARETGWEVLVVPVPNRFFGETVTVSGLLAGTDVLDALAGRDLGKAVFLPRSMFDAQGARTLDDYTPAQLEERLGAPVHLVECLSEVIATLVR